MKVHWTDTARGHLDGIYAYIAQDSPEYAKQIVDRLTRRSQQIAEFPFSGHRLPEYEVDPILPRRIDRFCLMLYAFSPSSGTQ